jgi:peptidoglycan/LPS O-acetylase OafA/YrhL
VGTLRTLFAIAVVFAHAGVYMFVGAQNGVQLFYVISGFLMSLVLTESQAYPSVRRFYVNRLLRLYPIYAAVALLTLVAYGLGLRIYDQFFAVYHDIPWTAAFLLFFSNAFIFLQDWVMFSAVVDGRLVPSGNFQESSTLLYQGLLVPQAWTLGVELTFYLVAPFILPKSKWIYAFLAISLALRVVFIAQGFGLSDPWSYRFFPTEMALFLLGSLSHQKLLPLYRRMPGSCLRATGLIGTAVLIAVSLSYAFFAAPTGIDSMALFALFLILMPAAFIFQNGNAWDIWIGELSYPIYICHMLVIAMLLQTTGDFKQQHPYAFAWLCVLVSAVFAMVLNRWIGMPVERIRQRFRSRTA